MQVQSGCCPIKYVVTTDARIRILVYFFSYWRHHVGNLETKNIVATTDWVAGLVGEPEAA